MKNNRPINCEKQLNKVWNIAAHGGTRESRIAARAFLLDRMLGNEKPCCEKLREREEQAERN